MIRFTRVAAPVTETLTLVRRGRGSLAVRIEAGAPDDPTRAFVGVFELDGERLDVTEWEGGWSPVEAVEFVGDEARRIAKALEIDVDWREDEDPSLDAFEVETALQNAFGASGGDVVEEVPGRAALLSEVCAERAEQDRKWGGSTHDDAHAREDWLKFIEQHVRKVPLRAYDGWGDSDPTERAEALATYRKQMIRIAALAIAAVESFDRKAPRP